MWQLPYELFVVAVLLTARLTARLRDSAAKRRDLHLNAALGLIQLANLLIKPSPQSVFFRLLNAVRISDGTSNRRLFVLEWYRDGVQDVIGLWLNQTGQLVFEFCITDCYPPGVILFRTEGEKLQPIGIEKMEQILDSAIRIISRLSPRGNFRAA